MAESMENSAPKSAQPGRRRLYSKVIVYRITGPVPQDSPTVADAPFFFWIPPFTPGVRSSRFGGALKFVARSIRCAGRYASPRSRLSVFVEILQQRIIPRKAIRNGLERWAGSQLSRCLKKRAGHPPQTSTYFSYHYGGYF